YRRREPFPVPQAVPKQQVRELEHRATTPVAAAVPGPGLPDADPGRRRGPGGPGADVRRLPEGHQVRQPRPTRHISTELEAGVDGFGFEGQDGEDALVDPPQRLAAGDAVQGF